MKKSQNIMSMIVDKPFFQHGMAYGNFKDSYLMAYKFFDKKTSASGIKNESMSDQQLADKLHRLII